MGELATMISQELVLVKLNAGSDLEALELVSSHLRKQGIVTNGYTEAVITREKQFPTGLQTISKGVAIPHADPQFVLREAIGIATLEEPVKFKRMELPEEDVEVNMLFMLAIKEPMKQVKTLQALMKVIQDKELLEKLLEAKDSAAVVHCLQKITVGD